MELKRIFDNTDDDLRNEIIDRISDLSIECPECESIIGSDEQYQCGTCGCSGGCSGRINVLSWIKREIEYIK